MAKDIEKYNKRGLQTSYVSVIVGISLVLFMLGMVIGTYLWFENLQNASKENIEIDLFFNPSLNNSDIKFIEQDLKKFEQIKEAWFVSPDRALEVFNDGNSAEINAIKEIYEGESPLPPSITFHPKASIATPEAIKALKAELLATYPNKITEINYNKQELENVNLGFLKAIYVFAILAFLLIIVAFAIINNTIRLSLYSKRFTIKTMQLVGAKPRFIRRPFLWHSILQGIVSAILGMALLTGAFFVIESYFFSIDIDYTVTNLGILFGSLIALGSSISVLSTWFALNKYLRKKLDDLY